MCFAAVKGQSPRVVCVRACVSEGVWRWEGGGGGIGQREAGAVILFIFGFGCELQYCTGLLDQISMQSPIDWSPLVSLA